MWCNEASAHWLCWLWHITDDQYNNGEQDNDDGDSLSWWLNTVHAGLEQATGVGQSSNTSRVG